MAGKHQRPSRNERLARITERGKNKIGSNARAAHIPLSTCSKKYAKICDGNVIVSIKNPDYPHLRIKLCGPCFMEYTKKHSDAAR